MVSYTLKRLLAGVGLLLGISTLTYFLVHLGSGNVARNILGDTATAEMVRAKEVELGLDQPLLARYFDWLTSALQGDFGISWFTSEPVGPGIMARLPVTVSLCLLVLLFTAIIATLLGVTAALRRGWMDRFVQILAIGGFAVPPFLVAVIVVTIFAIWLRILPATGYVSLARDPAQWARSLVLPGLALLIGGVASTAQQVRSAVISVLNSDFVRTLRSRGLPESEIVFRNVLRNAAPAGLTVLSLQFIHLLGGSFIIESVFGLPGIGQLAVVATSQSNLPMIMGIVTYTGMMVIVVNLLVDIANAFLNPKVRFE